MEHRDGTAPATTYAIDGKVSPHHYIKVEELDWEDKVKNPTTPMPLRTQQLEIRHIEILEVFKAFTSLIQGNKDALSNSKEYSHWDDWKDKVDTRSIIFAGHSFGGCTGIHLLTSQTPSGYEQLPISKAILHDPWMEPFPEVSEDSEIAAASVSVPILVINSEEFTLWKQHFACQKRTFDPWIKRAREGSTWLTIARTRHMAFSDFTVFFKKKVPMAVHEDMHQLTMAFVNGQIPSFFQKNKKRISTELVVDNPDDNKRKQMRANIGDIVIHETTERVVSEH
ncbi:hypothetical protein M408DRAFT_328785 [Serendipita vermifera MAFF 305830]|uniref:1-alkyl-2-acetylglycerophosphocholine esterase n=1 Tax=Serendipita vermifera MAFF 305830 TaxID=933852 RepID=A0A0C2WTQ6_SERVB|nr:hypothetical protein M408DRAFT_328785 [Serendipita vermifera MAFF 305830]